MTLLFVIDHLNEHDSFYIKLIKCIYKTLLTSADVKVLIQKPSLKSQTASNADIEARWLGKTP